MKSVHTWLDEYGESHRNPVNKTLHWLCVPLILLSIVGLLWSIPVPGILLRVSPLVNWGVLFMILALAYYYALAWRLALGMTVIALITVAVVDYAALQDMSLWRLSAMVFVVAWIGQFIGHAIEGRRPTFFKDLQFLLIGPLWLLAFVYRRAHIAY